MYSKRGQAVNCVKYNWHATARGFGACPQKDYTLRLNLVAFQHKINIRSYIGNLITKYIINSLVAGYLSFCNCPLTHVVK